MTYNELKNSIKISSNTSIRYKIYYKLINFGIVTEHTHHCRIMDNTCVSLKYFKFVVNNRCVENNFVSASDDYKIQITNIKRLYI